MKIIIPLCALLLAGCTQQPVATVRARTDDPPPGRYQIINTPDRLIKLDTATGNTWQFQEATVATDAVREGKMTATGWMPIEDFAESLRTIESFRAATNHTAAH